MVSPSVTSGGGDEFQRILISNTMVYRYSHSGFKAIVDGMERRGQLGELAEQAARDFEVTGGSVLGEIASRTVIRRRPMVSVSLDLNQPMFAHAEPGVILVVSSCVEDTTVAVTVNICFSRASSDQLVAVGQSMYHRRVETPVGSVQLGEKVTSPIRSVRDIQHQLAEHLGLLKRPHATSHFRCIEIRQFGNLTTASEALDKNALGLYGILAADEGWRYVGAEVAQRRFNHMWSTRGFVGIVSLGDSTLSLNLRPPDYSLAANSYFEHHFGRPESYFSNDFCIAGLEHGPFLARELAAYRQCVAEDMRKRLLSRRTLKLKVSVLGDVSGRAQRNSLYRSLVEDLVRLRDQPPAELAALVNMIEQDSGLPDSLDSLRQEVQALENEEQTLYLYRVNRVLVLVAWIGIVVAAVGVVAAIGPSW